jgi:hypothetical protein
MAGLSGARATFAGMEPDERELLRLDYEKTTDVVGALTDVRFKLLAFIPTIAGATVGLLANPASAAQLVGVGLLGFIATAGILMYELRNSQLYDAAIDRAKVLEDRLHFSSVRSEKGTGGPFTERPAGSVKVLGSITAWHDRALALVYAAALAGWGYLLGWGVLRAAGVPWAQEWGAAIGLVVGLLVFRDVHRIDQRGDKPGFG